MKEIGGYLELEAFTGKEYHSGLLRLNLGRTALSYCLDKRKIKKLYLPYFLCDSVTSVCQNRDMEIQWYSIHKDFTPSLKPQILQEGEYLYLVNYYGQISNEQISLFKDQWKHILVDNTHAFFQKPVESVPTLYSCRKFFGLPDGAYLSLPGVSESELENELDQDTSNDRMTHILGRYEHSASPYYQDMLDTAHSFYGESPRQMSGLTRNLLRGIDYQVAREKRNRNFHTLSQLLGDENPLFLKIPDGPFVYPFYTTDGQSVRKKLAQEKIFVPVYWSNVIKDMTEDTTEYKYAANILPLPCDQRYGPDDMERIAKTVKRLMKGQKTAL